MRIPRIVFAGALALAAAMPALAADGRRMATPDRRTDLLKRPEVAPISSPAPLIQQLLAGNTVAPATPTAAQGDRSVVYEKVAVELGNNEVTRRLDDMQVGFDELQVRRRESREVLDRFLQEAQLGYVAKRLEVPAEILEQRRTR